MVKQIVVAYGVDVDAVSGWLGSYDGQDSPSDISRGMFAGESGVPRLLELFRRNSIATTWFWPGHSIETFPREFAQCVAAGHEIGLHGYSHENPLSMTAEQETAVLDHCIGLITENAGKRPVGYTAPWWEVSDRTIDLLLSRGVIYDHSFMHRDHEPYYLRSGDNWTRIDYANQPETWMRPLERGRQTSLVEIPASWYLDDLPPMMFVKNSPNSHGFVNPRHLEELWRDQFDWVYREYETAIFPISIHPDVSGRPQALLMHERLINHFRSHPGVHFVQFDQIAHDFCKNHPLTGDIQ